MRSGEEQLKSDNVQNEIADEEDIEKITLKNAIKASLSRQRDETFAALAFAAKSGEVEAVRQLLRRGAEINAVDYDGRSVLAMVRFLLRCALERLELIMPCESIG